MVLWKVNQVREIEGLGVLRNRLVAAKK